MNSRHALASRSRRWRRYGLIGAGLLVVSPSLVACDDDTSPVVTTIEGSEVDGNDIDGTGDSTGPTTPQNTDAPNPNAGNQVTAGP